MRDSEFLEPLLSGELARMLAQLEDKLGASLRRRREISREQAERQALYAKLGLAPTCPDFVLKAARTAYRRTLHPDAWPERHKPEAERLFKTVERAFTAIYSDRQMRP